MDADCSDRRTAEAARSIVAKRVTIIASDFCSAAISASVRGPLPSTTRPIRNAPKPVTVAPTMTITRIGSTTMKKSAVRSRVNRRNEFDAIVSAVTTEPAGVTGAR